jgi:hypothetical protein
LLDLISRIVDLQLFYVEEENRDERGASLKTSLTLKI